jgi:hypothetical protein
MTSAVRVILHRVFIFRAALGRPVGCIGEGRSWFRRHEDAPQDVAKCQLPAIVAAI